MGRGTYVKHSVDNRDRIVYRNKDYNIYGMGDFILYYEGPNEGGRQNWLVGTQKMESMNLTFLYIIKITKFMVTDNNIRVN